MTHALHIHIAQVNPTVGSLAKNADLVRRVRDETPQNTDLIVFPEMVMTGYPLEDLVLKPSFLDDTREHVMALVKESKGNKTALLLTTPWEHDGNIYNAFHVIHDGEIIATRYKCKLPNYGVFDEARVFKSGPLPDPVDFMGHKLGIMICEDMWSPDVTAHLSNKGADILIIPNGSPFDCRKTQARFDLARKRVEESGLPLIYVNPYGGQDELVFDGGSFILNQSGTKIYQAPYFTEHFERTVWEKRDENKEWLCTTDSITPVPDRSESTYTACVLGLRDYWYKNGHTDALLGLSGGIDSALSAAIAVDALGADHVHAVMMPSPFTSQESLDAAGACAKALGIDYQEIAIDRAMQVFEGMIPNLSGLAHENMQSRIRGVTLMSLSNMHGHLVLSTGNKSENAVGYATLYGDMCGAFSVLKDMFKTQVYSLSKWRNENKPAIGRGPGGEVIPEMIINRPPTAELRENQKDQDSLPPYEVLDEILRLLVEDDLSLEKIVDQGFDKNLVMDIWNRVDQQEYKRRQGPPGVKLTTRSFGRERRYPMTNNYRPSTGYAALAKTGESQ